MTEYVNKELELLGAIFNESLQHSLESSAKTSTSNISSTIEKSICVENYDIDILLQFKIKRKSSLSLTEPNKNGDKMATEKILAQDLQTSGSSSSDSPNSVQSSNSSQNSRSRSPRSPIKSHLKNQSEKKLNSPARKLFGKSFHCSKCPRKFTWEKSLVRHLKNKHKQREIHEASIIDMPEI